MPEYPTEVVGAVSITGSYILGLMVVGGVVIPHNNGVLIVSGSEGKILKVYYADIVNTATTYSCFYFGGNANLTSKRFCPNIGSGRNPGFMSSIPLKGKMGDGIYVYKSGSAAEEFYSLGYVLE